MGNITNGIIYLSMPMVIKFLAPTKKCLPLRGIRHGGVLIESSPSHKELLKMKRAVVALSVGLALAGCGNADREKAEKLQGEVSKLQSEVATLKAELDAEKHGAQRLLARAKDAKDAGNKASAKSGLQDLIARHPEKPEAATADFTVIWPPIP